MPAADPISLLLLEPDPWRAASLSGFLAAKGFCVVTEGRARVRPGVVLADLAWAGNEVRDRLEALKKEIPEPRIAAFLASLSAESVFPSLKLGVKGVLALDASPEEVHAALLCVHSGSVWAPRSVLSQWLDRVTKLGWGETVDQVFTRAERRVFEALEGDLSNKEIGQRLGITEATVKFHVGKLLKKTGTSSRRDLVRLGPLSRG